SSIALSFILPIYLFGVSDFELINHVDKDVTGDGVYVGVIDSAINKDHPSLAGKILGQEYSEYQSQTTGKRQIYTPEFSVDTHGSHVAGIIVAAPDSDEKVEGVATGAKIYGVQITGYNTTGVGTFIYPDVYEYYNNKNVNIINNSWNAAMYPLSGLYEFLGSMTTTNESFLQDPYTAKTYLDMIKQSSSVATDLMKLSKEKNTLSVFAAGNEGIISPGLMGLIPYYDEGMRSFITVGALDSSKITKNDKGQFVISLEGATLYSNGLKGAYNFGLVAPGTNIKNVNASYGVTTTSKYRTSSGTSQATPMVTAAAALVAEKFKFLDGKQIADVLLSTANRDYIAPKVVVKQTDTKTQMYGKRFTVFYVDSEIPKKSDGSIDYDEVEMDVIRAEYYSYYPDLSLEALKGIGSDYAGVQKITKEELFGQGILDIDKALNGIEILDANRLSDSDVKSDITGSNEVYYSLNLGTHNAEFSNDISQRKWEKDTHNPKADNLPVKLDNLNVGLIKTG
ncbi:MAG: S8 family serine peptidase, partial [Campylobacter sp.]|nr:S8 family serine peptidase [Campylobacter sp.]